MSGDSIEWALSDIDDLQKSGSISAELAQLGKDAVATLFSRSTVFASVFPIDGSDLGFYWVAGDRSIEIDIAPDGTVWYSVRSGEDRQSGEADALPPFLSDALEEFSAVVDRVNPKWRDLYWRNQP